MAQGRAGRPPAGHCCAAGPTRLAFRIPVLLLALNTPASGREAENKRPSALSGRLGARSGPEATHKDKGSPAELFSASSVKGSKRLIAIWDGGALQLHTCPVSSTKGAVSHLTSAQTSPWCAARLASGQMWHKGELLGSRLLPAAEWNSRGPSGPTQRPHQRASGFLASSFTCHSWLGSA